MEGGALPTSSGIESDSLVTGFNVGTAEDSFWMPLRPSGPIWERHLLSGSPALCPLLSFPFHWWKDGTEQLQLQSGTNKGPGWNTKVAGLSKKNK